MPPADPLLAAAAVAAGLLLGRILDRSRFSLDRAFRRGVMEGDPGSRLAWLLAVALVWLGVAALGAPGRPEPAAPAALMVAGFVAGVAMAVVGSDPVLLTLEAGATRPPALAAWLGWLGGVALGTHGPLAWLVGRLRDSGPPELRGWTLDGLLDVPAWLLAGAAGVLLAARLLYEPVRVRPGRLEWPKAGAGLALLAGAGWWLAARGGELSGPNALAAARRLLEAGLGGRLWLQPSLLVGVGVLAYGFAAAAARGRLLAEPAPPPTRTAGLLGAGVLLGLSTALAGGDPTALALFGLGSLHLGSAVFVLSLFCGSYLMGLLEWRLLGRPGGAPSRGYGV